MLFFRVVHGKRTVLETVRNVQTPTRTWHTLAVDAPRQARRVELDGKERLKRELEAPPAGRSGSGRRRTRRCCSTTSRSGRFP